MEVQVYYGQATLSKLGNMADILPSETAYYLAPLIWRSLGLEAWTFLKAVP